MEKTIIMGINHNKYIMRNLLVYFIIIICLLVSSITAYAQPDITKPASTSPLPKGYNITFDSNVPSATLLVDGKVKGKVRGTYYLNTGTYRVRLKASGYESLTQNIKVSSKQTKFFFDMQKEEDYNVPDKVITINLAQISSRKWAYPLPGCQVIAPYGGRRRHSGVDLKTVPNDKVLAAFDGEVTLSEPYYGYGNCIRIKHANGLETLYSHQSKNLVKAGQKVKAGQVIGLTGRTGRANTEHLHFELFYAGKRYDPAILFNHANHTLQDVTVTLANDKMTSKRNH